MKEKTKKGCLQPLLTLAIVFASLVPMSLLNSWAILKIWGWFLEPTTHVHISFRVAIGVSYVVSLYSVKKKTDPMDDEDEEFVEEYGLALLALRGVVGNACGILLVLGIAYLWHLGLP